MLDATLETPFLKRDQDGQILESGINYDWHEEMEG